jgi:hypothetical protein
LGLLVERARREEGEDWVYEVAYLTERPDDGVVVQAELRAHRWDATLCAQVTGDDAVLALPARRRRTLVAGRAAARGRRRDTLTLRVLPLEEAPGTVAGVARPAIDQTLAKHGLRLGASPEAEPLTPEPGPAGAKEAGETGQTGAPAEAAGPTTSVPTKESSQRVTPTEEEAGAGAAAPPGGRPRSLSDIYLGPAFPVPETIHTSSLTYLGKERAAGPKASRYLSFLEQEGFRAGFDDDGDVWFQFDGGNYYLLSEEDDPPYFRLLYPNFWPIADDGMRRLAHEAVSQVNQEVKGVKLVVTGDQVSAELELFLEPLDIFTRVFPRCLVAVRAAVERFRELMSPE